MPSVKRRLTFVSPASSAAQNLMPRPDTVDTTTNARALDEQESGRLAKITLTNTLSHHIDSHTCEASIFLAAGVLALSDPQEPKAKKKDEGSTLEDRKTQQTFSKKLALVDEDNQEYDAFYQAINFWPDQSVRVLRVYFQCSLDASAVHNFLVRHKTPVSAVKSPVTSSDRAGSSQDNANLNTSGVLHYHLKKHSIELSLTTRSADESVPVGKVAGEILGHTLHQTLAAAQSAIQTQGLRLEPLLVLDDESSIRFQADQDPELIFDSPLLTKIRISRRGEARFSSKDATHLSKQAENLRLTEELTLYHKSQKVCYRLNLHNLDRAQHKDGLWDLGDSGSVAFKRFFIQGVGNFDKLSIQSDSEAVPLDTSAFSLQQHASGGVNYDSPNHRNAAGEICTKLNGYTLELADDEGAYDATDKISVVKAGNAKTQGIGAAKASFRHAEDGRAEPVARFRLNDTYFQLAVKNFWQKNPSGMLMNQNLLNVDLVSQAQGLQELQGGESTTQELWFGLQDRQTSADQKTSARMLTGDHVLVGVQSKVHTSLPFSIKFSHDADTRIDQPNERTSVNEGDGSDKTEANPSNLDRLYSRLQQASRRHQALINAVLDPESPTNWSVKREQIDEFGWRNYGDLYADHESQFWKHPRLMASHYNNQYDPLEGFLKQYLAQSDPHLQAEAYQLGADLGEHVYDIDIYKTWLDKAEYNYGLFWHTDHYVEAATSSHRTYSREHGEDSSEAEPGGGPGGQHCYTGGLRLWFQLSGDDRYKAAVLHMTEWIAAFYEGTGSLTEGLIRAKRYTLPRLKSYGGADFGHIHEYPLDRGVGNYLRALLDSFLITGDTRYIQRSEALILNTISSSDQLELRELQDAENRWFYTVFLQALHMYIWVAEQHPKQVDRESFKQIVSAFNHYARWMLANEGITLDQPEALEYPTDTWLLQDLRKVHLLAAAAVTDSDRKQAYLEKAATLYESLLERIESSKERFYTRSQALLMQNLDQIVFSVTAKRLDILSLCDDSYDAKSDTVKRASGNSKSPAEFSKSDLIKDLGADILRRLRKFSLKKELKYLRARSDLLARIFPPRD